MLKNQKGFTLIELVMVTIILGILAAVAIPRYSKTLDQATEAAEKTMVNSIWAGCEEIANTRLIDNGVEEWPGNPLSVLNRTRNIKVNLELGIPDEDNEWQFSRDIDGQGKCAILHHRPNDEIYYYEYDSTLFYLAEEPTLYISQ